MGGHSLYERLGGATVVDAAVELFYRKVLSDGRIRGFFERVDMNAQRAKQKAFLTFAFGGPSAYTARAMRAVHANMALNEAHFAAVMEHLGATLKELGVADALIGEVAAVAASVKGDVLSQGDAELQKGARSS